MKWYYRNKTLKQKKGSWWLRVTLAGGVDK